ncbi:soluble interferon-gamma receptor-like protein [Vaccinia virus]|nr:soluble interferon-gamma receptor-like protein [Vaccinia virus]
MFPISRTKWPELSRENLTKFLGSTSNDVTTFLSMLNLTKYS